MEPDAPGVPGSAPLTDAAESISAETQRQPSSFFRYSFVWGQKGTPATGIALLLLGPVIAGTAIFTLRTMKGHTRNAAADEQAISRLTAQQVRIVSLCSGVILSVCVVMTVYGFIDYADMGVVPSDLEWSVGGCGPSPTRGTPEAGLTLLILGPLVIGMAVLMTFAARSHAKASSAAQEAGHVTEHPRDDL
jgi:hypothetical protein